MLGHPAFPTEPWCVRETHLHLEVLPQTESVFALGNGHLGLRGNLDEGEPNGTPGTYLNGFYELRPLPYAEAGYGYPESGQSVINVTNGKLIRLLVDDEPFDVRYGTLNRHERRLDLRAGTLTREVEWTSPAGQGVKVRTERLVSFTHRAVAAVRFEVEAVGDQARVVVQSELVANEPLATQADDPRVAAALKAPLVRAHHGGHGSTAAELVHRTARSGLHVAAAMDHLIDGPERRDVAVQAEPDTARVTITTVLQPGQRLSVVKLLGYGWSSIRSRQALLDQVTAAITAARHTGWDGLLAEQRAYLDDFWEQADVEVDGDPAIQQAVRFGLFHVLQASARAEGQAIPAKGLTGTGYDGHAFWDSETYVLPALIYTFPGPVADALRWRHSILPTARERAAALDLAGAAFPWRTIAGAECSGYWPAGTAAFHVNADIADAVIRYLDATGDDGFEEAAGAELLIETARLWSSLGHHDRDGRFRIPGVTGPDEYSAVADDNVYTNLMAQQNLLAAADVAARRPAVAERLGVEQDEAAAWRLAAERMFVAYDHELGVHPQSEGFTGHEIWDFEGTDPSRYPLFLHYPYFQLYRKQVVKQADLVLALQLRGDAFTDAEKARDFAYYEGFTARDSSLSAVTQSVVAAELGHLELATDYLGEASLMDLHDLAANTGNGLHLAALAGAWTSLVAGFGGLRARRGSLRFTPRLPTTASRMAFNVAYRGRRLHVAVTAREAVYDLRSGGPLEIVHYGEAAQLTAGAPQRLPVPPATLGPEPSPPPGRAPARRKSRSD